MAWGDLTAADIESHLSDGELNEYRQHVAQIEDPLPTLISDVIGTARGYLATRYVLSQAGIPAELRATCIDLIVYRLVKRVRGSMDDSDLRAQAAVRANDVLRAAADGTFGVFGVNRGTGNWGSDTRFRT